MNVFLNPFLDLSLMSTQGAGGRYLSDIFGNVLYLVYL